MPICKLLRSHRFLAACCLISVSILAQTLRASESESVSPKGPAGSIEGRVVYRTDPERPWRYSRYYVKDRKKGFLAEAVVAITGLRLDLESPEDSSTVVIDQKDFQFIPETVAIRLGDRIKFLNSDKTIHNVQTFHPMHSFNVNMPAGGQHMKEFKQASGIRRPYRIGCVYHSAMRAWIFVFDNPHFQVTTHDGKFRLNDVPPGEHQLDLVHPAGRLSWNKKINVESGKTTTVEIRLSPENLPKKKLP